MVARAVSIICLGAYLEKKGSTNLVKIMPVFMHIKIKTKKKQSPKEQKYKKVNQDTSKI